MYKQVIQTSPPKMTFNQRYYDIDWKTIYANDDVLRLQCERLWKISKEAGTSDIHIHLLTCDFQHYYMDIDMRFRKTITHLIKIDEWLLAVYQGDIDASIHR
jgi:hypothetical protein